MTDTRPLILILCTGNSCRSQMAEFLLRHEAGEHAEVASAGCCPSGYVHPQAIEVMQELGYDLSGATSKSQDLYLERDVAAVITVCGNADELCPDFPGEAVRHHWPFYDPADAQGTDAEKREVFRRVRDEIAEKMAAYGKELRSKVA